MPFVDERFDLLVNGFRIGFETLQKSCKRIVRSGTTMSRIAAGSFATADCVGTCDQGMNVVAFMAVGLTNERVTGRRQAGRNACMRSLIA